MEVSEVLTLLSNWTFHCKWLLPDIGFAMKAPYCRGPDVDHAASL